MARMSAELGVDQSMGTEVHGDIPTVTGCSHFPHGCLPAGLQQDTSAESHDQAVVLG